MSYPPLIENSDLISIKVSEVNKIIRAIGRDVLRSRNARNKAERVFDTQEEREVFAMKSLIKSPLIQPANKPYSDSIQVLIDKLTDRATNETMTQVEHDLLASITNLLITVDATEKIEQDPNI
jgi:hypothetical protein